MKGLQGLSRTGAAGRSTSGSGISNPITRRFHHVIQYDAIISCLRNRENRGQQWNNYK